MAKPNLAYWIHLSPVLGLFRLREIETSEIRLTPQLILGLGEKCSII
jgi:hypothetical protein